MPSRIRPLKVAMRWAIWSSGSTWVSTRVDPPLKARSTALRTAVDDSPMPCSCSSADHVTRTTPGATSISSADTLISLGEPDAEHSGGDDGCRTSALGGGEPEGAEGWHAQGGR